MFDIRGGEFVGLLSSLRDFQLLSSNICVVVADMSMSGWLVARLLSRSDDGVC